MKWRESNLWSGEKTNTAEVIIFSLPTRERVYLYITVSAYDRILELFQ